jgi:APA family basic amino acid/polyamine antiporter
MANEQPVTNGTLGLTGLTMNAMALIAPGAFLWLTFQMQSLYGAPMAGCAMWFGIFFALLLCFATAISYSELAKLYPGPGSSYLYAEQAFLSKTHAYKFARIAKFFTGWASHLYYWVYPGVMVGVTAILGGYLVSLFFPDTFSGVYNSPLFMIIFCIIFALGVAYIAYRGVTGTTAVNITINIIQISALLIFSIIAIGYRIQHPQGSIGLHLSNGVAVNYQVAQVLAKDEKGNPVPAVDADGKPMLDKDHKPVYKMQDGMDEKSGMPIPADKNGNVAINQSLAAPFTIDYTEGAITKNDKGNSVFNYHKDAKSVISPWGFNYIFIQAAIAILILVGFESVTSMGEEAKHPKRDIPRAVLLSLAIQGAVCYLIEYFAASYFLNSGYTMPMAGASGAPIGDMMVLTGTWLFGSYTAGKAFMLVQAFTVFLALIGTTLSCLSTGARVTYAMGRDEEVSSHFGLLHGKTASPYRAIWTLAVISAIIGIITVAMYLGGTTPAALDKHNIWYSFGIFSPETYTAMPNTLVIMTLISNFGTFLLYMVTCFIAMVAFREHHTFNGLKHMVIPIFGLLANLVIMLFYLIGPFTVSGMSWKEPYIALGVCLVWGIFGVIYFLKRSKQQEKEIVLTTKPVSLNT